MVIDNVNKSKISIVLPCYNEEATVDWVMDKLISYVKENPKFNFELLIVNDGSTDGSEDKLTNIAVVNKFVRVVSLSRNFGHQIAISAGLFEAQGDAVVVMDFDLQDPLETVSAMINHWQAGAEIVYGVRTVRQGETWFKKASANIFYRMLSKMSDGSIPRNVGDFRLMDRKVVNAFNDMPETDRFVRGMVSWLGFRQIGIYYERQARKFGETKYPLHKMLILSLDGIMSFSIKPLRYVTLLGIIISFCSFMGILYAFFLRILTNNWVEGWTLLFIGILFFGGINLFATGIVGEYVGRIYRQTKGRPLYLVSNDTKQLQNQNKK